MTKELLHSCPELVDYIDEVDFLPLLDMGISGWSAEEVLDEDCGYNKLPDGGWEWPLWEWKGAILRDSGCAYESFSSRRLRLSARNGGRISSTIAAVFSLIRKKEALRNLFYPR